MTDELNERITVPVSQLLHHPDWYDDGIEEGLGGGPDEQMWRLDPDAEHQLQLFVTVAPLKGQAGLHRWRLFCERDIRDRSPASNRVFYACNSVEIDQDQALALLGMSGARGLGSLGLPQVRQLIENVDSLPNDLTMCDPGVQSEPLRHVYQLQAEGPDAVLGGYRLMRSSTVFTTRELAEKRIPLFRQMVTDKMKLLYAMDPDVLTITVEPLEVVE